MRKLSILLVTVGLILTSVTTVSAKGFKQNFNMREGMIKKLNLTEQQTVKFNNIHLNHEEVKIDIESKLKKNKLELKRLLQSKDLNKQKFLQLTENASKLKGELKKSKTEMWFEIYNILDDSQKLIWKNHIGRMLDHGKKYFRNHCNKKMGKMGKHHFKDGPQFRKNG